MRRTVAGALLASALLLGGCGSQGGGSLEITENGTYDVSGYSQVVVSVSEGEAETATDEGKAPESLNLVRAQFRGFSMEVPDTMVEGYTEAELTENSTLSLSTRSEDGSGLAMLSINEMDASGGTLTLEDFSDAPQEDVNGIPMAVRHRHGGSSRDIEVKFMYEGALYTVILNHSTSWDDLYGDYSEQFYRTIQMN